MNLEALHALYDAVKAGHWDVVAARDCFGMSKRPYYTAYCASRGDMNAVLALMPAVLPGYIALCDTTGFAQVWKDESEATHTFSELVPGQPARALLLAILAAVIAIEESKT